MYFSNKDNKLNTMHMNVYRLLYFEIVHKMHFFKKTKMHLNSFCSKTMSKYIYLRLYSNSINLNIMGYKNLFVSRIAI